jgi:hypothetical protein
MFQRRGLAYCERRDESGHMKYKGGEKVVTIQPGTPLVRIVPASKSLIVPGAHVVAFPRASAVRRIVVGEGGARPPM